MIVSIDNGVVNVNMSPMNERERNILDAAVRVFSRYGVKRTSMGDLAEEAGVSRQTLYKAFRSKDDVLRAHIRAYTDNAIDEIEAALPTVEGLGPQLDLVFDKMVVVGFDMVRASPNASDIVEGMNESSQGELANAAERFREVLEGILLRHHEALARSGMSPADLSEFVQRSAAAAKAYAHNRKHLLRQLETLKQLCLVAAGDTAARRP